MLCLKSYNWNERKWKLGVIGNFVLILIYVDRMIKIWVLDM